jgi:lipid-A-disaccharide synthase
VSEAGPRIVIIAGEPSGDVLGARLMTALQRTTRGAIRIEGIGGEQMIRAGLCSRFPMGELSHMGLFELLPHLPMLLRRIRETGDWLTASPPDLLVTIDAPGFNVRLVRRLQGRGIALLHYVAPTVWAWKPKRAAAFAEIFDHLLAILPFEPPYFADVGLPCTYVGHPALETMAGQPDGPGFRRRHGIPAAAPVLCMLPGSRAGELRSLLPRFVEAARLIAGHHPGLHVVLPTVAPVAAMARAGAQACGVPVSVITDPGEKRDAFAASNVALAASGTVAVELAAVGTPVVIAYRATAFTAFILRRMIKVKYASLINLLLDRPATPELLQEDCIPSKMAEEVGRLLSDPEARAAQAAAYGEAMAKLAVPGLPSERAADVAQSMIGVPPRRLRKGSPEG